MIAALFAAALLTGQAQPPAAPALATPPPQDVTPLSGVTVTGDPAQPDPQAVAQNLADLYEKSCGGRLYGMYADACNNLASQLKRAQAEARKAARAQKK